MGNFRGLTDSIERLGGSVGMSNSDQQWSPFIPYRGIIHPVFPQKVKPIAQRTSPSKDFPKNKRKKESNKLL